VDDNKNSFATKRESTREREKTNETRCFGVVDVRVLRFLQAQQGRERAAGWLRLQLLLLKIEKQRLVLGC
jgi:hypothetical protein